MVSESKGVGGWLLPLLSSHLCGSPVAFVPDRCGTIWKAPFNTFIGAECKEILFQSRYLFISKNIFTTVE